MNFLCAGCHVVGAPLPRQTQSFGQGCVVEGGIRLTFIPFFGSAPLRPTNLHTVSRLIKANNRQPLEDVSNGDVLCLPLLLESQPSKFDRIHINKRALPVNVLHPALKEFANLEVIEMSPRVPHIWFGFRDWRR